MESPGSKSVLCLTGGHPEPLVRIGVVLKRPQRCFPTVRHFEISGHIFVSHRDTFVRGRSKELLSRRGDRIV